MSVMNNPRLWKIWGIAEANLKDARRYLIEAATGSDAGELTLTQFDEYLAHNELGLAIEEIAGIAEEFDCKAAFWKRLEAAAEVMELQGAASIYRERFDAAIRSQ